MKTSLLCALLLAAPGWAGPQDPLVDDLVARGRKHLDAGENARALELFEQADAQTRGDLSTRMWVLRVWFAEGRINDGFDQLDRLAEKHAGPDVDYLYGMGSYLKGKRYIVQGVPDNTTAFAFQDAQSFLGKATGADPAKYWDAWHPLAEAAWFNQDLATAEMSVDQALVIAPQDAQVRFLAARIDFSRYTALNANEATQDEAQMYLASSITGFRAAAQLVREPKEAAALVGDIHKNLGIALQWNEQKEAAVEAYAEAVSWDPNTLPYGDYWSSLGIDDFVKALETGSRRFTERWGDETNVDATLLWWLGWAYYSQESYEPCEAAFLRAVKKWPPFVNSWFYVGMSRYRRGEYDGAIDAWHENWKIEPTDLVKSLQSDRELHLDVLDWMIGWCAGKGQEPGTEPAYNVKASFLCEVRLGVFPENWEYWDNWGFFARDGGEFLEERAREGDAAVAMQLYETSWKAYNEAMKLAPDKPHLVNDAAAILHYHLDRDLERALEMYEKALAMAEDILARPEADDGDRALAEIAKSNATKNIAALKEKLGGGGGV